MRQIWILLGWVILPMGMSWAQTSQEPPLLPSFPGLPGAAPNPASQPPPLGAPPPSSGLPGLPGGSPGGLPGFPGGSTSEPPLAGSGGGIPPVGPRSMRDSGDPKLANKDPGPSNLGATNPAPSFFPVDPPFPQVLLRTRVAGIASPNEEVTYRINLNNPTAAAAHQVRVRQSLPNNGKFVRSTPSPTSQDGELVWQLATMEAGATKEIVVVFLANGNGDLDSTARVSFEYGQSVKTRIESALQVRTGGPQSILVGDTFTLVTEVAHAGSAPLDEVTLTQTLPLGVEFLNSKPSTAGDSPLVWRLGKLQSGETKRIEIQLVAKKSGPIETVATVTSGTQKREANLRLVAGQVSLELTKGGPDRRAVGRPATYFITVANKGTSAATNVKISHKLDPNIELLSASGGGANQGGDLKWTLPTLGPGQKQTVTFVLRALRAGELKSRTEVVADKVSAGLQAEKSTRFESPKGLMVELDKVTDPVLVGEQSAYTVRLLNFANQPYTAAVVAVTLPEELQVVDARGQTAADRKGQRVVFAPLSSVTSGVQPTFTVYGKATKAAEARIRVEVTATELGANPILFEEGIKIQGTEPPQLNSPGNAGGPVGAAVFPGLSN